MVRPAWLFKAKGAQQRLADHMVDRKKAGYDEQAADESRSEDGAYAQNGVVHSDRLRRVGKKEIHAASPERMQHGLQDIESKNR